MSSIDLTFTLHMFLIYFNCIYDALLSILFIAKCFCCSFSLRINWNFIEKSWNWTLTVWQQQKQRHSTNKYIALSKQSIPSSAANWYKNTAVDTPHTICDSTIRMPFVNDSYIVQPITLTSLYFDVTTNCDCVLFAFLLLQ